MRTDLLMFHHKMKSSARLQL